MSFFSSEVRCAHLVAIAFISTFLTIHSDPECGGQKEGLAKDRCQLVFVFPCSYGIFRLCPRTGCDVRALKPAQ
jgi:hypothetical protein